VVEHSQPRLTLTGVGAMRSPRFRPAGLLVDYAGQRVMIDGGGDEDVGPCPVWLTTDERAELMPALRRRARVLGVAVSARAVCLGRLVIEPRPVVHTSHPTYGYLLAAGDVTAVWAPEFWQFPAWAAETDLMFADGAGWARPIRFARGVGGHACVLDVAAQARRYHVRRLVFAHLGRPTLRALDQGLAPAYGEIGHDGQRFVLARQDLQSSR
jgi:hypothetical protein